MKYSKLLSLCFLVLIAYATATKLDVHSDDHDDDDDYNKVKREVKIEVETNKVVLESKNKLERNGIETENKILFEIENSGYLSIKAKQEFEQETGQSEVEQESEFKVKFLRLIEFKNINGKPGFQSDDEVVTEFDLKDVWTNFMVNTTLHGAATVHQISTKTQSIAAEVTVEFLVSGDTFNVNGVSVEPSNTKFSVAIDNYTPKSTESFLALEVVVESEKEFEVEGSTSDEVIHTLGEFGGLFSWEKTASVSGKIINVISESIACNEDDDSSESDDSSETESCETIVFSFDAKNPSNLWWDPSVGYDLNTLKNNSGVALIPAVLVVVLSFFALF